MKHLFTLAGACLLFVLDAQATDFNPAKTVIIKADDFRVPNQAWTNFLTSSRDLGIKVGLGVVVESIVGNATTATYLQDQQAMGDVEFWNHGWDHSKSPTNAFYEFKSTGLASQQTHFADAQAGLLSATGRNAIAFGTPYNQYDADTVAIMNDTPAVRLFFTYTSSNARTQGLVNRVATVGIIPEAATGSPVASSFIAANPNGPAGPVSLQFHPAAFTAADLAEYVQIVQFLQGKGYTFMLPAEYIAALDGNTGTPPNTPPVATAGTISTTPDQGQDIDLRTLASDAETPDDALQFSVNTPVNGSVVLLADGYTARFTPAENHTGPASFSYTVRDGAAETRTLLNYTFQPPDVTGDAMATDVSGNACHGTLTQIGIGSYTYTADHPAPLAPWHTQSLNLYQNSDQGGARLICGLSGSSVINFRTADWTAVAWVKRTNTTDQDIVFHLGANLGNSNGTTPTSDFTLGFNAGSANTLSLKNYSSASLTTTPDVDITTTVSVGEWHHLAIVRAGGTLTLYVDGVSAGSDNSFSLDIDPTTTNVAKFGAATGASVGTTKRYFNGSMADLAIFNAALPAADITRLQSAPVADLGGLTASNSVSITVSQPPASLTEWRQFYFETTENSGSAADSEDPDGDGLTNAREYVLGTVPTQPDTGSSLVALSSGGGFTLNFVARQASGAGYAGLTRRYTVQSTTDLTNPALWENLTGYSEIVGVNQTVTLTPPYGGVRCFYRLSVTLE